MADFGILQPIPNFAQAALGGAQAGRAIGRQQRIDAALQTYASDPSAGITAVNAVDPVLGSQLTRASREQQEFDRREKVRTGLVGAIDPTTGKLDPVAAQKAYLDAGDVEGAMGFQKSQTAARKAELEGALTQIQTTVQLLGSATDANTYAAARQQAASLGLDVSSVPEIYDPAWVRQAQFQALDVKDRISAELAERKFSAGEAGDAADRAERVRHNRTVEGQGAARIGLARKSEARQAAKGEGGDSGVAGMSTADLLRLAGE